MAFTERDAIYFAGLFDGEGCILLYRRDGSKSAKSVTVPYHLRITMSNTHRGLMAWVHRTFGGNLFEYKHPRPHRAMAWKWAAYSTVAKPLLIAMLPHLIVKREQAVLALEFQARVEQSRLRSHPAHRGQPPLPPDEIAWRDAACQRILDLRRADKIDISA